MKILYLQSVIEGVDPSKIGGIGFDATCSTVVLDEKCHPITVSSEGKFR